MPLQSVLRAGIFRENEENGHNKQVLYFLQTKNTSGLFLKKQKSIVFINAMAKAVGTSKFPVNAWVWHPLTYNFSTNIFSTNN